MRDRPKRVASLLIREASQIVQEELDCDGCGMITILRADVSRDLRNAKLIYSVLGTDEEKRNADNLLKKNKGLIKKLVNDRIRLRYAVDLMILREEGIDHAFKIDKILDQIRQEDTTSEKGNGE